MQVCGAFKARFPLNTLVPTHRALTDCVRRIFETVYTHRDLLDALAMLMMVMSMEDPN